MFDMPHLEAELVALDAVHRDLGHRLRAFLRLIRELDEAEVWRTWGAGDTAHLLSMRYDISHWKALRWVAAAHALEGLPRLAQALSDGELGLDSSSSSRGSRPPRRRPV